MSAHQTFRRPNVLLEHADALACYSHWAAPTCIISDGPYGLGQYPGESKTTAELAAWYEPHAKAWYGKARSDATLWFWCSEIGWATVHPVLERCGWRYEECCIWDKGVAHVAGNVNSRTIRSVPVVTEVAVRYTRKNLLPSAVGSLVPIQEWLRSEWCRSGLPLRVANVACGVKDAATRKYLTQGPLWYFPPPEAVLGMAEYCRLHGVRSARPYFSLDGEAPLTVEAWLQMRAKWHHQHGITNVWEAAPVSGEERVKVGTKALHPNQKPLELVCRQIELSADVGDIVWEPFSGLCTASVASLQLKRHVYAAETNEDYYKAAVNRLRMVAAW